MQRGQLPGPLHIQPAGRRRRRRLGEHQSRTADVGHFPHVPVPATDAHICRMALWSQSRYIVAPLVLIILGHWSLILQKGYDISFVRRLLLERGRIASANDFSAKKEGSPFVIGRKTCLRKSVSISSYISNSLSSKPHGALLLGDLLGG